MNVPAGHDHRSPNTFSNAAQTRTLSDARLALADITRGEAVGLLPKAREDGELHLVRGGSDLDSKTRDLKAVEEEPV